MNESADMPLTKANHVQWLIYSHQNSDCNGGFYPVFDIMINEKAQVDEVYQTCGVDMTSKRKNVLKDLIDQIRQAVTETKRLL